MTVEATDDLGRARAVVRQDAHQLRGIDRLRAAGGGQLARQRGDLPLLAHDRAFGRLGRGRDDLLLPHAHDVREQRLADLEEQALAVAVLFVVLLDVLPAARELLRAAQPVVTLPVAGREDHRHDRQAVGLAALDEVFHLDVRTVLGIEEALADQDQGDVGLLELRADLVVPLLARGQAPVDPELRAVLFQGANEAEQ